MENKYENGVIVAANLFFSTKFEKIRPGIVQNPEFFQSGEKNGALKKDSFYSVLVIDLLDFNTISLWALKEESSIFRTLALFLLTGDQKNRGGG